MALGLTSGSGSSNAEIIPYVKYDARSGRIFRPDRTEVNGEYITDQVEITNAFRAVMDLENIEVGWFLLNAGVAPVSILVPLGSPMPPKPAPDYKQGVRFMLKLDGASGGDVREMSAASAAFVGGFDVLHDEYTAGRAANPGKLPVVKLASTEAVKSGSGKKTSTNYKPNFVIEGWAPRPADLVFVPKAGGAAPVASPSVAPASYAPSTGSTQVGPPPVKVAAPAMANDFG